MKYSINGAGNIVAERDIYSLGGFIPKGTVGGNIASEAQLSQDGECWLAGGDISGRPDICIKDNAYVGTFTPGINPVHTDCITEFSGNTLIPGNISVRSFVADTKNNVFIKDSFIGVSMDVLCGSATGTNFPFEQGNFKAEAAKGTLFTSASMRLGDTSACRDTATLRLGRNTYLYIPTGYSARVYWAYYDNSNQLAYSGESTAIQAGLIKLNHSVYRLARVSIAKADGTAMTPAQLGTSRAKILGHINSSPLMDIRPESASGEYAMVNSSFIAETDNFGLDTTQLRFLAGGMYDTTMYTKTDRQDYKPYGTFRNVERLEYTKYLGDSHRTNVNRDRYISAYDCPLLRVDDTTYNDVLAAKGNLTLRRCIVPKAEFQDDVINGNTYEDLDFSFANEDLGLTIAGYARFISSHKQGIYRVKTGTGITQGLVSHKGNLEVSTRLYTNLYSIPLDGDIIEQGSYTASVGQFYGEGKSGVINTRIRTGKPVSTQGLILPVMPSGYVLAAAHYLDEGFKFANSAANPSSIKTDYPYVVFVITRADPSESALVSEFIALNMTLRIEDHTKAPEITGSAYVGEGCVVRGDVKLIGDPYVNRVFDVNMWERGTGGSVAGETWDGLKRPESVGYPRLRTRDVFPVDTTVDNNFTCTSGYKMLIYYFGEDGKCSGWSPWGTSLKVSDPAVAYISILVSKTNGTDFIEDSDIPLANVKYVRAFKKRRYIVNELDRTSPEDVLLSVDYWEQGTAGGGQADAGKTYEELKAASGTTVRLKRPINVSPTSSISSAPGFSRYIRVLDAVTKFHLGESLASAKMALLAVIIQKDPSGAITPSEIASSRLVLEFVPQPRIIVPYGSSTLFVSGPKIRMYDNAVLSRNFGHDADIVLQGDAVMGYDFSSGDCLCSNGHDDAIIKLP